ncbi:Tubulin-specific chaperone C [Vanrija pseudolonga]|uniref:Tubulin-specific chaperone C n=1 Tax=Vanrija pseudolonga TaxID=143232 RepID=A0AAF0Y2V2_9TREE|nr:Tubulin-specific chaperone C [Vanrija pseudolonga]
MASTSAAAEFYAQFQAAKADITAALATDPAGASSRLASLRADLAAALPTLPAYDQRSLELQVRELEASLRAVREKEKPKSKFAFKRATPSSGSSKAPSSAKPSPVPTPRVATPATPQLPDTTYTVSARTGARITPEDYTPTGEYTLTLSSLARCVVDLRASSGLTSLHARDLDGCVVLAPVLGGSVMLSGLRRCVLVLGAQQFRLHSSTDTAVFLHVGSLPVIEGCERVTFAPLPGAQDAEKRYAQVQDFDWVRGGPSPHFKVVHDAGALDGVLEGEPSDAVAIVDKVLAAVTPAPTVGA